MQSQKLAPPQLVINSRMLYSSWIPADPEAAAALLPRGPKAAGPVYMNQYVVDSRAASSPSRFNATLEVAARGGAQLRGLRTLRARISREINRSGPPSSTAFRPHQASHNTSP